MLSVSGRVVSMCPRAFGEGVRVMTDEMGRVVDFSGVGVDGVVFEFGISDGQSVEIVRVYPRVLGPALALLPDVSLREMISRAMDVIGDEVNCRCSARAYVGRDGRARVGLSAAALVLEGRDAHGE